MDIFALYVAVFFTVFLIMPIIYFSLRCILWVILERCGCGSAQRRNQESQQQHAQHEHQHHRHCHCRHNHNHNRNRNQRTTHTTLYYDRQGNIFTISDDASLNAGGNYADFFYVEPNSEEAARIRAQLEKDDKDLPSYDEVMGMNNLATPTAGIGPDATTSAANVGTNTTTATIAALPAEVPPYSEVDPLSTTRAQGVSTVPSSSSGSVVITIPDAATGSCAVPSTSRAAAAAAAAGTTTTTTTASIPIINSSSNTTV